jgi:hypothetical protein
MVPIKRSTYARCQGDRGAESTCWMPIAFTCSTKSAPKIRSRSRSRYRGAVSQGKLRAVVERSTSPSDALSPRNGRSAAVSFARLTERCRTPNWWRNARISNWSAARLRNEAASEAIRAVNICPKGNRTMSDNSQSISAIGVYENHRRARLGEDEQNATGRAASRRRSRRHRAVDISARIPSGLRGT